MDESKEKILERMKERKSIRDYTEEKVSEEDLRLILECARFAPSGENAQPWRFIVVRDQESKDFLAQVSKNGSGRRFTGEFLDQKMEERFAGLEDEEKRKKIFKKLTSGSVSAFVNQADLILIVCGRKDVWDTPYDCSAAIENILLAVSELKLGCCWVIAPCIDVRDEVKIKEYFNIPDELKVISIFPIGYPARIPHVRPRLPLEELVYREKYGDFYYQQEEVK
ncbi:MAG: nitroreductase family protein [Candidatus Atribacteria bacterium]|nr:nitroreductase family protein [Candidatus Atribacteria bacterium]